MKKLLALPLALVLMSCGDEPAPEPPPRPGKPPPSAGGAPAAGTAVSSLAKTIEPSKEALLAEVRKRTLANEDFIEGDANRDPFRSYLSTFAAQVVINKQHKILMEKFSLDELKLIAIIGGNGLTPRAMFVEPSPPGAGVLVQRGDHISKADALVTRIAPDRVFVQIQEDEGGGKTRTIERVLELHAGEGAQ